MKIRYFVLWAALFFVSSSRAQNPIINDQFAADPTARVFNDRVYLFPSHDIMPPEGQRQDWFCMADYHVFSSDNLTDWTDHGVIVSQEEVPWGNAKGFAMWAPDCVYKEGKYYFYFPDAPRDGRGFAVGVATATLPEGPYKLEQTAIKGVVGIDPCVLMDNDGQSYIYWSGMGLRGAKLKANMLELDGESKAMEGLPEGFKEGPFVFRRGDWYYLTFPWVRHQNGTEALAYAMSKSPLGPWDFKGVFMEEHSNRCWTNHHSFLEYKGQWYLFYHHNDYSPRDDKRRSPHIDRVTFLPDGTIQPVTKTLRGVGITPATACIEMDRYSSIGDASSVDFNNSEQPFLGWHVNLVPHSWVRYNDVDFSTLTDAYLVARVRANANTSFCLREGSPNGRMIAKFTVTVKNEQGNFRRNLSGQWLTLTAPLEYLPHGTTDLVATSEDDSISIDWIQFKSPKRYFTLLTSSAAPSQPDERGFIRRWHLREPIPQDLRTNTVFTDTWLRHLFTTEQAKLAKKAKWYDVESEEYNLRLFHFAEQYGKQAYGNLFWCETAIICSDDIRDVRLAAGSNGASMWWLNGEEILLLSGDRRMVEDDGVSPRLTLKKGVNILRCAVVNGPGLSDLCVRFIDEKGNPITNYLLKTPSR
jgi:hypothetical protein